MNFYKIYEVSAGKPVEVTELPLALKPEEVATLENTGFKCEKV